MVASGPAKRYAGRITPYVVLTCIVAASGGALFGCAPPLCIPCHQPVPIHFSASPVLHSGCDWLTLLHIIESDCTISRGQQRSVIPRKGKQF